MKRTIITNNFLETKKLGKEFAQNIKNGQIICLHGDLGSGKTTFTQGFAEGLGLTNRIISPTFIIMRTYALKSKSQSTNLKNFYHVDLYRLESEKDVEGLGLREIINDPQNIVVIEWPEKIEAFLPSKRTDLFFAYLDENKRQIIIE